LKGILNSNNINSYNNNNNRQENIKITFEDFVEINKKYPSVLHPIFKLQDVMRKKVFFYCLLL
jgi:hypothetical protein